MSRFPWWLVTMRLSFRLCAPAILFICRDASQRKMASLGPAKWGSRLPHLRANKPHVVANGASELFPEIFGERGAHARSTFGSAQIPFGACVEIDLIAEVIDRADAPKGA